MEYLIRKANGTTVRVGKAEYAREVKEQRLPVAELGERRWGAE